MAKEASVDLNISSQKIKFWKKEKEWQRTFETIKTDSIFAKIVLEK
jgi:uncharacterized protein YjcR